MAYFSNSSEGMVLDEKCLGCHHGFDDLGELKPCAVLLLQTLWNYEQWEKDTERPDGYFTQGAKVKQKALDILIPNDDETVCSMFVERRS